MYIRTPKNGVKLNKWEFEFRGETDKFRTIDKYKEWGMNGKKFKKFLMEQGNYGDLDNMYI
jgi:hypothetical protein